MNWQELRLEDKPVLDSFLKARYYENSHYNFITLFMWREPNALKWAVEDGILYFKGHWKGAPFMTPPFCAAERLPEAVEQQIKWFRDNQAACRFYDMEKQHAEVYSKAQGVKLELVSERDDMDYVYNTSELINLSGRRFHTKKNHFNSFRKTYPEAEYLTVTEELLPACRRLVEEWAAAQKRETPEDPYVDWEHKGMLQVLDNFAAFGIRGGAIRLEERIVAFTFGEQLNADTVVVHVEKADPEVRGAYTAINREFLAHEWAELPFTNRQEDMGLEGLRKAKESYRPCRMVEKWNAFEIL